MTLSVPGSLSNGLDYLPDFLESKYFIYLPKLSMARPFVSLPEVIARRTHVYTFCPVMYIFCLDVWGIFIKLFAIIFGLRVSFRLRLS